MGATNKKLSLVTTEPEVFKQILKRPVTLLALHVSAILIDISKMIVVNETYLNTFFDDHKEIPTLT